MLNDRSSREEGRATRRLASDALSFAWLKRRVVLWIGETTCRLRSGRTTCRSRPLKQNLSLTQNDVVLNNQNDAVLARTQQPTVQFFFFFFVPLHFISTEPALSLSLSLSSGHLFRLSLFAAGQDSRRR